MPVNNQIEVTIANGFLTVENTTNPNASIENYNLAAVTSVNEYYQDYTALNAYSPGRFPNAEEFTVVIDIEENPTDLVKLEFDIQNVTNQAGWTIDRPGLLQAVEDIKAAVSSSSGGGGGSTIYSTIANGNTLVATAGTAEPLVGSSTPSKLVVITALASNTDTIVLGSASVVADLATRSGSPLEPGDSMDSNIDDLANLYLDSVVSGEGVSFTYYN